MKQFTVKKPWGGFIQFTHNEKTTVKILEVKSGEVLSYQSHQHRAEFWYVLQGQAKVILNGKIKKLKPGQSVSFGKGVKHRLGNESREIVRVLEISSGNFIEEDIIRYEDKYKRD